MGAVILAPILRAMALSASATVKPQSERSWVGHITPPLPVSLSMKLLVTATDVLGAKAGFSEEWSPLQNLLVP